MRIAHPRGIALHPLFFALLSVFALYLHNIDQVSPVDLLVPVAFALSLALAVFFVCSLILKPRSRAAVMASVVVLLFFTYGHLRIALKSVWPRLSNVSGILLLLLVLGLMVLLGVWIRRRSSAFDLASAVMNVVSSVMLLSLILPIAVQELRAPRNNTLRVIPLPEPRTEAGPTGSQRLPDIYFVVLDRYPSLGTALDVYGHDNRHFLDFLRTTGFYVAESSVCNYARTDMSLASTMGMTYVGPLLDSVAQGMQRRWLSECIQEGVVWKRLRDVGYRTYHLGTWWRPTRANRNADVNFNYGLLSEFAMQFYKTTLVYPLGALLDIDSHREQWLREQAKFAYLDTLALPDAPVFVFAHFLLPHEPYVFSHDGSYQGRLKQREVGTETGFVNQMEYLNTRLRSWIESVLEDSARTSVIVLEADEGPHPPENFSAAGDLQTLSARFHILTAYYFPDADYTLLRSGVSPVNTFRVIFAKFLGDDLPLLPDRSFTCVRGRCLDVTDEVRR